MVRFASPSSQIPYQNRGTYQTYVNPYSNYSPYANYRNLRLNNYPHTLSIPLPEELFQDLSDLAVDPATLDIIPQDVFERPKQPDPISTSDLSLENILRLQPLDESVLDLPYVAPSTVPLNLWRHMVSPLFTSPQNYQQIGPDGRTGTLVVHPEIREGPTNLEDVNRAIYEAKKARGDEIVYDILGRPFTPDIEFDLSDQQDFVDESFRGQVDDYLRYNPLDENNPESVLQREFVVDAYADYLADPNLKDSFSGLPSGNFLSSYIQSKTALVSPLARTGVDTIDRLNEDILSPSDFLVRALQNKLTAVRALNRGETTPSQTPDLSAVQESVFATIPSLKNLTNRSPQTNYPRTVFSTPPHQAYFSPLNTLYKLQDNMRLKYREVTETYRKPLRDLGIQDIYLPYQDFQERLETSPSYRQHVLSHYSHDVPLLDKLINS